MTYTVRIKPSVHPNQEDREKMLKIHNKLKEILSNITEVHDLWMSDIRTLEEIVSDLRFDYNFVPPTNEDGERMLWSNNWVMGTRDDEE